MENKKSQFSNVSAVTRLRALLRAQVTAGLRESRPGAENAQDLAGDSMRAYQRSIQDVNGVDLRSGMAQSGLSELRAVWGDHLFQMLLGELNRRQGGDPGARFYVVAR